MPQFDLLLYDAATNILNAVTAIAIPALSAIALNYLRKKTGISIANEQKAQLDALAVRSVQTASQLFRTNLMKADTPEQRDAVNLTKRDAAVGQLIADAASIGQKLAKGTAINLIEAGVNRLKRDRGAL